MFLCTIIFIIFHHVVVAGIALPSIVHLCDFLMLISLSAIKNPKAFNCTQTRVISQRKRRKLQLIFQCRFLSMNYSANVIIIIAAFSCYYVIKTTPPCSVFILSPDSQAAERMRQGTSDVTPCTSKLFSYELFLMTQR